MDTNETNKKHDWILKEYQEVGASISVLAEHDGRKISNFKDLWVWQKGRELVKDIYVITRQLPSDERFGLTSQLRRAAVSVPSNIAEGWARNKTGYFNLGLSYARGSIHEIETQLLICTDLEYTTMEDIQHLLDKIAGISTGLLNFMNKLDQKR